MAETTLNRMLTRAAVSDLTGLSRRTLERQATDGTGIPYVRVGLRKVAYREADVRAWLAGRTFPHRAAELANAA